MGISTRRMPPVEDPGVLATRSSQFTLADLFRRSARVFADRIAVVSEDVELTYRDLDERSDRLAQALRAEGLEHGDRITVLSTTRPEYVEVYLAAAKLGVTVVALNTRLHPDELLHCIELGRPRLMLSSAGLAPIAERLVERATEIERLVRFPMRGGDPDSEYERLLAGAVAQPVAAVSHPEDIHCVLFTSGTTGRPKGAMISQRASVMRAVRCADWFELTPEDGMIGWIPMFHTGGDECLQATLLTGGKFATFEQADPPSLFRGIARHRLTWTAMLPGLITDFLHHPERTDHDLSSLRFTLGYANMMPRVVQEFTAATDSGFWDTFGQTESSFVVALDLVGPGEEPSLRKRPAPLLDVRIVDDEMRDLPVGVPGECVVRGPSVMSGYLEDPEATAAVFRGGWLHTGDVLVRNDDGTYTYVDRLKYLIKTGGENVYPAEVEQVITAHPSVREACAISVPDPRWGETVKAVVVLEPGSSASAPEIRDWCHQRLAGFKRPRFVQFLEYEQVPRSTTGKILRHELEALEVTADQKV
jgi:acyl-CoA synthetase (AMP-forming)/AMP-acid ligase II